MIIYRTTNSLKRLNKDPLDPLNEKPVKILKAPDENPSKKSSSGVYFDATKSPVISQSKQPQTSHSGIKTVTDEKNKEQLELCKKKFPVFFENRIQDFKKLIAMGFIESNISGMLAWYRKSEKIFGQLASSTDNFKQLIDLGISPAVISSILNCSSREIKNNSNTFLKHIGPLKMLQPQFFNWDFISSVLHCSKNEVGKNIDLLVQYADQLKRMIDNLQCEQKDISQLLHHDLTRSTFTFKRRLQYLTENLGLLKRLSSLNFTPKYIYHQLTHCDLNRVVNAINEFSLNTPAKFKDRTGNNGNKSSSKHYKFDNFVKAIEAFKSKIDILEWLKQSEGYDPSKIYEAIIIKNDVIKHDQSKEHDDVRDVAMIKHNQSKDHDDVVDAAKILVNLRHSIKRLK